MSLMSFFSHKKQIGILIMDPPHVKLARVFASKRTNQKYIRVDGHRRLVRLDDVTGLRSIGFNVDTPPRVKRVGSVVVPKLIKGTTESVNISPFL